MASTKEERRKQKAKGREIRSSLLILDLKDDKLLDSRKEGEGETFHNSHVLGMIDDCLDRAHAAGSETWKYCE